MRNFNRIDLGIFVDESVDRTISCGNCPSACCRKGMAIHLMESEANSLRLSGTELTEIDVPQEERRRLKLGKASYYRLDSDCGNLVIGEDGQTSCLVYGYESPLRPHACDEFVMGGIACAATQAKRVERGEDEFVIPED
jgi:hypothetical protein